MITQLRLSKIRTPTLESVLSPLQRVTHSHTTILVMTRFFQYPCSENQRPVPGSRFCSRKELNTYKKKSPVVSLGSGLIIHWSSRESQRSRSDEVLSCVPTPVCVASLSPVACVECNIKAVSFILIVYHFTTEAD